MERTLKSSERSVRTNENVAAYKDPGHARFTLRPRSSGCVPGMIIRPSSVVSPSQNSLRRSCHCMTQALTGGAKSAPRLATSRESTTMCAFSRFHRHLSPCSGLVPSMISVAGKGCWVFGNAGDQTGNRRLMLSVFRRGRTSIDRGVRNLLGRHAACRRSPSMTGGCKALRRAIRAISERCRRFWTRRRNGSIVQPGVSRPQRSHCRKRRRADPCIMSS